MTFLRQLQKRYYQWLPYDWWPKTLWYRLKCWAYHRYSTVRPRHLPHTWVDRDDLLFACMFQIVGDFLEKELPDWKDIDAPLQELKDLWAWWNQVYLVQIENCYDAWFTYTEQHPPKHNVGEGRSVTRIFTYESPEVEAESRRLFQEAEAAFETLHLQRKEKALRIIHLSQHLWT